MSGSNINNTEKRYWVGIDAGSVSLNGVVIDQEGRILVELPYRRHLGRLEDEVSEALRWIYAQVEEKSIQAVAFTGNHGRMLSRRVNAFYEFETIAQVLGALHVQPDTRTIISMGGQDTSLFQISHQEDGWELEYFNTNGPCASGTGSFIDQQAQRLATAIYDREVKISQDEVDRILVDFIRMGMQSDNPANVACRCTVFTKSDMIHLQNKGEKLEDIIYGLHVGNARNYVSTIVQNRALEEPILFVGGLSLNELQVRSLRGYFPGLLVPPYSTSLGALGVALQARNQDVRNRPELSAYQAAKEDTLADLPVAPRLELRKTVFPVDNKITRERPGRGEAVYLGLDIGSTTTKYALMDRERKIVHKSYVHTRGKPIEVTQQLLSELYEEFGEDMVIKGVATTGSGRNVVGTFLNADLIIDEITAHARGAVEMDPEVDTIFEIGGQDSKYIYVANRYPLDFDMNKVCAAGTGSFLHELANKYGINIVDEFQEIALSSSMPVRLAERCTVFMESDLVSYLQQGVDTKDLIAGLCYAVVYNYLNRVVGKRKVGTHVMFLGGPSLNKAVVGAFENVLGRPLTVPKHREVLGAYGAAISVQEKMHSEGAAKSQFRGILSAVRDKMEYTEKICRADPNCHNRCKLKIYNFDGRKTIWGGECGRYEAVTSGREKRENAFKLWDSIWERHMKGLYRELAPGEVLLEDEGRPTVGMQRSLYTFQTGILWAHFFNALGYRLVLTPPTNGEISSSGIESVTAETCYPVKVSHGHIKSIAGRTRYLFLPTIIDMPTPTEAERGFFCPMVQSNRYMVQAALDFQGVDVLHAIVHLRNDPDLVALELAAQLGKALGRSRSEIRAALGAGLEGTEAFSQDLYSEGKRIMEEHDPREPLVIVTGRPYNLYDERLNLRLGQNLAKIGVTAVPMDMVDVSEVDLSDFPSMYWGLGARILRTAKFVRRRPETFGLHLTNFSCGADSFVEHFFKHIMGEKPYLILELDEHSAVAGVMTRLEAFRNVVENAMDRLNSSLASEERKLSN
ncbi:MAG: acyl-CoA dehydratase activase [Desulfobacteraceae bacterium]